MRIKRLASSSGGLVNGSKNSIGYKSGRKNSPFEKAPIVRDRRSTVKQNLRASRGIRASFRLLNHVYLINMLNIVTLRRARSQAILLIDANICSILPSKLYLLWQWQNVCKFYWHSQKWEKMLKNAVCFDEWQCRSGNTNVRLPRRRL